MRLSHAQEDLLMRKFNGLIKVKELEKRMKQLTPPKASQIISAMYRDLEDAECVGRTKDNINEALALLIKMTVYDK